MKSNMSILLSLTEEVTAVTNPKAWSLALTQKHAKSITNATTAIVPGRLISMGKSLSHRWSNLPLFSCNSSLKQGHYKQKAPF